MPLKISSNFDGGAIDLVSAERPDRIDLHIPQDSHAEFSQWFYFRLQGARDTACTVRLLNASTTTFPDGWKDYLAVASYDQQTWFRVPTSYDGRVLTIDHTPEYDSVHYAYFEPYSRDRNLALLSKAQLSPLVRLENIATTYDGRDLNLVVVGNPSARYKIWVIARQHPGETMAEWFVEGMLDALIDNVDPIAASILQESVFYLVPNMNPDGSVRGNLRTSATGTNLNREWMTPSLERSPEVFAVRARLHETGCDVFLDVHGDEGLPYVFVAGSEMLENFSEHQAAQQQAFIDALLKASPDFQTRVGYGSGKYRKEMLRLASKYVAHHFKCVSLTLEMPFKDNAVLPMPLTGWSGARSAALGKAMLQPILDAVQKKD